MAKIIGVSICLSDIDKAKIKQGKNGKAYLDLTVAVNDSKDQYGKDVQVYHAQSKEERDAKEKKKFLGNGLLVWDGDSKTSTAGYKDKPQPQEDDMFNDLPF